jgi:predicted RNA polymerase sigma factor
VAATPQSELLGRPADAEPGADRDDSLTLLFLCCHPALSAPSQIALTLRAVGGLSTAQIAAAFLVPETTLAQRISRAKQSIKASALPFAMPDPPERAERLRAVLHVLYLIFNEGYTATSGSDLTAPQLSDEAIRLTGWLRRLLPDDREVSGLLALMLLTDARRAARTRPDGSLVPLAEQDRSEWDRERIAEGVALITEALSRGPVGPYQLQAAIAAIHDEAEDMDATDWRQILALYELLERIAPNPMVTVNRAGAVAMVHLVRPSPCRHEAAGQRGNPPTADYAWHPCQRDTPFTGWRPGTVRSSPVTRSWPQARRAGSWRAAHCSPGRSSTALRRTASTCCTTTTALSPCTCTSGCTASSPTARASRRHPSGRYGCG